MKKEDIKKEGEPKLEEIGLPYIISFSPETNGERAEKVIRETRERINTNRCERCGHGEFSQGSDKRWYCSNCGAWRRFNPPEDSK